MPTQWRRGAGRMGACAPWRHFLEGSISKKIKNFRPVYVHALQLSISVYQRCSVTFIMHFNKHQIHFRPGLRPIRMLRSFTHSLSAATSVKEGRQDERLPWAPQNDLRAATAPAAQTLHRFSLAISQTARSHRLTQGYAFWGLFISLKSCPSTKIWPKTDLENFRRKIAYSKFSSINYP